MRQITLIHHQQIRPRNTRTTLPRHLISTRDINNIDDEISQLTRVIGGEVVTAGLDEQEIGLELFLKGLQGEEVCAYIFTDGGVRAAACFDGADTAGVEGFVAVEELGVFTGFW
jgi:hypothetical protein